MLIQLVVNLRGPHRVILELGVPMATVGWSHTVGRQIDTQRVCVCLTLGFLNLRLSPKEFLFEFLHSLLVVV